MVKRDDLKRQREADTRVALLGLAANCQAARQGKCLSSAEMALLLDAKCSTDQRQSYLTHLGSCDSCYDEWRDVQQELDNVKVLPQKKTLFFQQRFLTISGSLLAAAASVVFYINMETNPGPQELPSPAVPQLKKVQPSKEAKNSVRKNMAERPVALSSAKKENTSYNQITADTLPETESSAFSGRQRLAPEAMVSTMLTPVDLWIKRVQKECLERYHNPDKWHLLVGQGKELSAINETPNFALLLVQVEHAANGDDPKSVCTEIQRILMEK